MIILIYVLIFSIIFGIATCLLCCFRIGKTYDDDVRNIYKEKERKE